MHIKAQDVALETVTPVFPEEDQIPHIEDIPAPEPKPPKKQKVETSKIIVWICLINGFLWVWCSYILAALDKIQIAESLSQVAVTQIIGVVLAYCVKAGIENLSKNNTWPDKPGDDPPGVG